MIGHLKHYIKVIIGKSDAWWFFEQFQKNINDRTLTQHQGIIRWAEDCLAHRETLEDPRKYLNSTNQIVRQGWQLKKEVEKNFKNVHSDLTSVRILVHVPDEKMSPGGFSLFQNIVEGFKFIGIATEILNFNDPTKAKLESFRPSILITSDHKSYLDKMDWDAIKAYRASNVLRIGLTAGLEEYGNTPLISRLNWAKQHAIDFYYTYRTREYVNTRKEYQPFHDANYPIFPLPFGVNPLIYYPVPLNEQKDLDYIFIASAQGKSKGEKYYDYLRPIVRRYSGLISGPGWPHDPDFYFNRDRDRYLYARAKIGINIHLDEQIRWPCEVNERTYQLAACGIPQVVDHAKLLDTLFSPEAVYVANTPQEYKKHFDSIISNPAEAERRALIAQKEVFEKYTTFHRASEFVTMLSRHFGLN